MIITFWKGVFVADSRPEDGNALKRGGFDLHEPTFCEDPARCKACRAKIGRRYWSNRIEDATRLRKFCNPRAIAVMKEHLARLAKSRALDAVIDIPAPPGLEYLPYQKAGVAYALQRKDTLVGDEAGLGKTIESLGFINKVKPRTVLVVAPATLAFNWKLEAEKWLVNHYRIFIPKNGSDPIPPLEENERLLVITNYEKVVEITRKPRKPKAKVDGAVAAVLDAKIEVDKPKVAAKAQPKFADSIKRVWDLAIFDEVQAVKNPASKRSQAVLGEHGLFHRAHRTLCMTGTPIENYPKEIWALAATICPAKFGDWWEFARRYCGLHQEENGDKKVWVSTGGSHLSELQQRLRSTFMVRRLKRDVLKELPPKRRQLVVLGDEEVDWSKHPEFRRWKELYEREYEAAMARLEAARTLEDYKHAAKALDAVVGIVFTEMSEFRHQTALAKLPMCLHYIDDLLESGLDSLVIFAHHKDVLEKIHKHYEKDSFLLYGETPMEDRGGIVQGFQAGQKRIFIGGLKPAGTGITLTRASTVVYVEIDWNPATLSQSEDRLCRIGQKKMVHVIHLALNSTLDVNMSQRVIKKQEMIDKALDHLPEHIRMKQAV